jgi:peptidoglycan/LPS O-acetylase OafA/YrhL
MATRSRIIPALTSIRGIAAWWVVAYHFREYMPLNSFEWVRSFYSQGYLAVDLFFVLSGFVLFLNYGESFFSRIGKQPLLVFFSARLARIYPLYFAVLLLFLLNPIALSFFSHSGRIGDQYNVPYFILSLLMIQNWGFTNHLAWNVPGWSISTESFAYLSFPPLAHCVATYLNRIPVTIVVAATALTLLALIFWSVGAPDLGFRIPQLGLARCCFEFLGGMCICNIYKRIGSFGPLWPIIIVTAAFGLIVGCEVSGAPNYLVIPTAFCLLIFGLAGLQGPLAKLMEWRPLVFLGEISYSTYMIHFFLRDWVKFTLVKSPHPQLTPGLVYVALVFAASVVLFRFIEVPGRLLFRRRRALHSAIS